MSNQITFLTEKSYQYLLQLSLKETPTQKELREATKSLPTMAMQISPEQAQFMSLLIRLMKARKTLEIGVYTGYSALTVAQVLPEDGRIVACDISEEWTNIAKQFWQKAAVEHKISLHLAPATETLDTLLACPDTLNSFDFAFIDADKHGYGQYYEQ